MTPNDLQRVICFHGSPGSPEEFFGLERHSRRAKVLAVPRGPVDARSGDMFLGYSWGAAEAVLCAAGLASGMKPRAVILVAPYVFATPVSLLKQVLLRAPVIGTRLLKAAGAGQMKKFAEKSASPQAPTAEYQSYCLKLAEPAGLLTSIFEKHGKTVRVENALRRLGQQGIPVWVVRGDADLTSGEAEQIEPLRRVLRITNETVLKNAGHALPWTHAEELARILDQAIEKSAEEA